MQDAAPAESGSPEGGTPRDGGFQPGITVWYNGTELNPADVDGFVDGWVNSILGDVTGMLRRLPLGGNGSRPLDGADASEASSDSFLNLTRVLDSVMSMVSDIKSIARDQSQR